MASNDKPVYFISSSMSELAEERRIVRKAVAKIGDGAFETFCFEEDAVAQSGSPQEEWRRQLERTDTTVGLLYQKMGEYTAEELRLSRERNIPVLLFRKKDKDKVLERDAGDFMAWLEDAETGITAKYFKNPKQLKKHVKDALARQMQELFAVARGPRRVGTNSVDGTALEERAAPKVLRRSDPPNRLRRQRLLAGRGTEVARLSTAIERAADSEKRHIALIGPDGIGKQALLRYVTHSGDLPEFTDGTAVHPNWKSRDDLEDLRQALWEEFYDTGHMVDPRGRDRQLREIEALIFLPAADGSADITELIDETMPRSVFCTSRTELTSPLVPIKVGALTDADAILAIFEDSYGAVPDEARGAVLQLCQQTGGNPGKIELLATEAMMDAPDDGGAGATHPLVAWAHDASLDAGVTPEESRVLTVAQDVGDVHTPREVLADVVGSSEPVDAALRRGHLRAASPRYRLNPVLEREPGDDVMPDVFASTLRWVENAPHAEIFANRAFVQRMLSWGCEQERWSDVITLGRRAETSFAMGGRHGAWRELLEAVAEAARRIEPTDEVALSWALHQLGARSLLRDELDDGRAWLFESFRHRQDDPEARALTRQNLQLLPAAVLPFHVLLLVPIFLTLIVLALALPDDPEPQLDVDFGRVAVPESALGGTEEIERWAGADVDDVVTVTIDRATIDGIDVPAEEVGFCLVVNGRCVEATPTLDGSTSVVSGRRLCPVVDEDGTRREVDAGNPCVIDVGFTPPTFGDFRARLRLDVDDGSDFEGTLTATAVAAIVEIDPDIVEFENAQETLTITNVGNVPVELEDLDAVQALGQSSDQATAPAAFGADSACPSRLEPGAICSIVVRGAGSGSGILNLEFTADDDVVVQVLGDARVLLVSS